MVDFMLFPYNSGRRPENQNPGSEDEPFATKR